MIRTCKEIRLKRYEELKRNKDLYNKLKNNKRELTVTDIASMYPQFTNRKAKLILNSTYGVMRGEWMELTIELIIGVVLIGLGLAFILTALFM